jgi:hypothetical protein
MNEGESFPAKETRLKKRGSGFRFSSKKALECSRLTRLAKAGGCEFTSVTRTLFYASSLPSELSANDIHGSVATLPKSHILELLDEIEKKKKEPSNIYRFHDGEYPEMVRCF